MYRLKELREAKRISQQKLALDLVLSQASISKYEIGLAEPDVNTIIKLANYFGVSIDYLLGNSNSKTGALRSDLNNDELDVITNFSKLTASQKLKASAYINGLLDS